MLFRSIVREGEVIIPDGKSIIEPNDRIIVFSLTSHMPLLNKLVAPVHKGGIFNELWGNR